MSSLIRHSSTGIPLSFIAKADLSTWLTEQPQALQNWLTNCDFKNKGMALIADSETGSLEHVYCLVNDLQDFWLAGDLSTKLPAGCYQIHPAPAGISRSAAGTRFCRR